VTTLVVAAHGSADPRAAANTRGIVGLIARMRPGLDVRAAFCERSTPNLRDVLAGLDRGHDVDGIVVAPLLLADAYHAQVDIPSLIARSGECHAAQADVLGEDDRLVRVMHERLAELGVSRLDGELGVLVVAVGSSRELVNRRTGIVASSLSRGTRWAGAAAAFASGPQAGLDGAVHQLRRRGARRLVIAPWFLAPGRLTDRVAAYARDHGIAMAEPLGAHPMVAATVLDRYDAAVLARAAA
jgi:sirohydrochlorin ferrochelatase